MQKSGTLILHHYIVGVGVEGKQNHFADANEHRGVGRHVDLLVCQGLVARMQLLQRVPKKLDVADVLLGAADYELLGAVVVNY